MSYARLVIMKRAILGALCAGALVLSTGAAGLSASPERGRKLHITKECSEFTGAAGSWCTITASNIGRLPIGTRVFYSQAAGVPKGLLDSNVVLDAGNGNRAVGRCTLDLATGLGLCTFYDGTGRLAGFEARVNVTCPPGIFCDWDGTFDFDRRD